MARSTKIEDLVAAWAPRLAKAFLDAIALIRDGAQIGLITSFLERADFEGAIRAAGLDPVAFRDLDSAVSMAFEAGGNLTTGYLPALREPSGHRLEIRFDVRNRRAEDWLKDHSSRLITDIVTDQRNAIRQALVAGMAAGTAPRDVALDIVGRISPVTGRREGGVIGLTASQEAWSRNYAAELAAGDPNALTRSLRDKRFDRSVTKAIKDGQPIPSDTIQKMVAAYRTRALRYRAETIGRTEALTSLHQAQSEAVQQAIDAGQVQRENMRKIWRSAADSRVRDTHQHLNGTSIGFGEAFRSTSGARLMFPGDTSLGAGAAETVQCRCTLSMRYGHLANVR